MQDVVIIPKILTGKIKVPPSKSLCHRAIIAAGLSQRKCKINNVIYSEDIIATCKGMEALGSKMNLQDNCISVSPESLCFLKASKEFMKKEINCNESGSTLRFLIPLALLTNKEISFTGKERLFSRPLTPYYEVFKKNNVYYREEIGKSLTLKGKLTAGDYYIPGNVSSQFISGMMFALPLLNGDSRIILTNTLESRSYVDMTINILKMYSVKVENNNYKEFYIKGNQKYISVDYTVEGDFSQAAFWIIAGVIAGRVQCNNVDINSFQGDRVIVDILKAMGGDIEVKANSIFSKASSTKGTIINASQCPDLVPILAVLGAVSEGITEITNAGRLRIKESDRLKAISTELNKLGADILEKPDSLIIKGKKQLVGGIVDSWKDHRIEMALAIASIKCRNKVVILNGNSVNKSYPNFYRDFSLLGGVWE